MAAHTTGIRRRQPNDPHANASGSPDFGESSEAADPQVGDIMSKASLILVDDDRHVLNSMAGWLRTQDYQVDVASTVP